MGSGWAIFAIALFVAFCAAAGAAALYGQLDGAKSTFAKVVLWILIVVLGNIAFGIGSCCAIVVSLAGNHR